MPFVLFCQTTLFRFSFVWQKYRDLQQSRNEFEIIYRERRQAAVDKSINAAVDYCTKSK